jgi:hypothetical protein
LPSFVNDTIRESESGQRATYSISRCPSSGIPKHHIPALSPASIRTDVSTLNPECFQPRTRRASAGAAGASGDFFTDLVFVNEQGKNTFLPEVNCTLLHDVGYCYEMAGIGKHAFCDERMDMNVPVQDDRSVRLYGPDHGGNAAIGVDFQRVNVSHRLPRRMAEFAQKTPVIAKIHPRAPRNREYPLTVGDFGKHLFIESMRK